MIPNNRKPFPFSRLLSRETPDIAARKELEEVVKWFQDEIDALRDSVNTFQNDESTASTEVIDGINQRLVALETSLASLAAIVEALNTDPSSVDWSLLTNVPTTVTGFGITDAVRYRSLAQVALTGEYKHLKKRPSLAGEKLYLHSNYH